MTLDDKIKIEDKLRGGLCAAAVGLTIAFIFCFNFNFQTVLYFNA
jgi:hypothetical protein